MLYSPVDPPAWSASICFSLLDWPSDDAMSRTRVPQTPDTYRELGLFGLELVEASLVGLVVEELGPVVLIVSIGS